MDELRYYENYDEWEGKTVSAEKYNELVIENEKLEERERDTLAENEELKKENKELKKNIEYFENKIIQLNELIYELYKELKAFDKNN